MRRYWRRYVTGPRHFMDNLRYGQNRRMRARAAALALRGIPDPFEPEIDVSDT